ncbi:MAG: fatty acid desaturase [Acidimicrobiia bacterium]|nr:fatty acid desaturase [Acidimicrobiia bacterium]
MTTLAPDRSTETADTGAERPTTLLPVIRSVPGSRYDNPTWKGLAYLFRDLALYALVLTGLALTDAVWFLVPLWALSALVVSALFIIGHDAAHESLFKSKRLNSFVGHLAMLPSWHVYEGWVLGHNRIHHGHTVRQGMDFVWHPYTPEEYEALPGWQKLRHRFEWSCLGAGIYYLRDVWWNKMIAFEPPAKWQSAIRRDRWIVAAFLLVATFGFGALGLAVYGSILGAAWMVVKLLVVPFLLFNWVIGSVVHLHHIDPGIRWYKRREWNKFRGQMEGTTVIYAPRWLDFFLHHIFVHVPHHVDMRIPFHQLPAASDAIIEAFPGVVEERKLRLRDYPANTKRCKLYDFEAGRWLTYDDARAHLGAQPAHQRDDGELWQGTNSF